MVQAGLLPFQHLVLEQNLGRVVRMALGMGRKIGQAAPRDGQSPGHVVKHRPVAGQHAGGLQALNTESANYVLLESHVSAAVVLNSYIGGVTVFLGPALGAALMTFFGYAVSDLTRSWLLYQGVLFVLVMMFMPVNSAITCSKERTSIFWKLSDSFSPL